MLYRHICMYLWSDIWIIQSDDKVAMNGNDTSTKIPSSMMPGFSMNRYGSMGFHTAASGG